MTMTTGTAPTTAGPLQRTVPPRRGPGPSAARVPTARTTPETRRARRGDRGSVAPVVVAAVLLACLLAAGVARAGGAAVRTARAGAVADLTALAAVSSGRATAERVAARSGATLVDHASLG